MFERSIEKERIMNKIAYIDMDNVLVDFPSGIDRLDAETRKEYEDRLDEVPRIFSLMAPMPGAIEAYNSIAAVYDTYILSTAPWANPTAWSDKIEWVHRHLGFDGVAHKRLILSHHKSLNVGDYLIDDRPANGADKFTGEWIHFGQDPFPDWEAVTNYLIR
jgi:5'-nucleotidase